MLNSASALDLDLRLVRYFVVTAQHEHVGRAAEELMVAQPSLSRQLSRLEAQVGARLLDRTPRGTRLTEAGRMFLAEAETLLRTAHRARAAARSAATSAEIAIGLRAYLIVTPAVRELRRQHPEARIRSVTLAMDETHLALLDRRVDVAVTRMPFPGAGLAVADLHREGRALVVPLGHRLAGRSTVTLADFADEPLVRFADEAANAFWRLDPRPDGSSAPDGPLVSAIADKYELVAQGQALAIVPDVAGATGHRDDVVRIPIEGVAPTQVVIATRAGEASPLVRQFTGLVRQLAAFG